MVTLTETAVGKVQEFMAEHASPEARAGLRERLKALGYVN